MGPVFLPVPLHDVWLEEGWRSAAVLSETLVSWETAVTVKLIFSAAQQERVPETKTT